MTTSELLQRAKRNGAQLEDTCVSAGIYKWEQYMEGATRANKKEVVKIALIAGIIDEEQAREEIRRPYFNPYNHFKTKTHAIYVHSMIEHFIKIN